MRMFFGLLVVVCCLSHGDAIFKQIKSKLRTTSLVHPQQPLLIPEPLPAAYARTVPTYTKHVSTFRISLPPVETYAAPITTYAVPHVAPVAVYAQPWRTVSTPVVIPHPETVYVEPFSPYLLEEYEK